MKTALIGLGRIAWKLEEDPYRRKPCTHAGSLRELIEGAPKKAPFTLTAVCDHHEDKIATFRRWWERPRKTADPRLPFPAPALSSIESAGTDAKNVLHAARPEFVIIATRTDSHVEIATEALRSGARAILLEKPVALELTSARKLLALAKQHRARVWINFERRYHPAYRLVKRYVEAGTLGPLRSIHGQVLTWPVPQSAFRHRGEAVGPLLHDAIHWIHLLLWYAGQPDRTRARLFASPFNERGRKPEIEDTAFVDFEYPEFTARLESGGRRGYFEFGMQLDFEHGRIRAGNEGHFFFRSAASKRYKHFRDLKPFAPRIPNRDDNAWLALYRDIAKECRGGGDVSYERLESAVAGMELIEICRGKRK